ncbi:MAG: hypothetical protein ACPLKS_04155 [Caldisericum exile]|uniref:hypothetical protein n=1 Tax=Caldisericum exile TaxID=693075 RepID=UPI003C77450A
MKKRVLFVSFYLPPFLTPQSIQIGRILNYLKSNKFIELHVVTANLNNFSKDMSLYPDLFNGINSIFVGNYFADNIYITLLKNRLFFWKYQKPDIYLDWHHNIFQQLIKKYPKNFFDFVITFSYPLSTNLLGCWLKEYFNCQWFAHQSDPWADNPYQHFNFYTYKYNTKLEKECFSYADKLIFVSEEMLKFYVNKYTNIIEKSYYIPHSYDTNCLKHVINLDSVMSKNFKIFRYVGFFYGRRLPEPFLKSMSLLPKVVLNKIRFEIVGGGTKVSYYIRKYGLTNYVKIIKPVNYLDSLVYMKSSDVLVLIDGDIKNSNFAESIFFPSKLVDYIGTAKPILGICPEGTSSKVLRDLHYPCHKLDEIDAICHSITNYVCNYNIIQNKIMHERISKYDINYNIKKFENLFDE